MATHEDSEIKLNTAIVGAEEAALFTPDSRYLFYRYLIPGFSNNVDISRWGLLRLDTLDSSLVHIDTLDLHSDKSEKQGLRLSRSGQHVVYKKRTNADVESIHRHTLGGEFNTLVVTNGFNPHV